MPFFLIRKKDDLTITLLHQNDQSLYKVVHDKMTCASFSEFKNIDNQFFIYGEGNLRFTYLSGDVDRLKSDKNLLVVDSVERDKHVSLVNNALRTIHDSDLKKVVLSRKHKIQGDFDTITIIENLLNTYLGANCYFWSHPKIGQWCGATPEVLLNISGNMLHTMSLAGTMKKPEKGDVVWGDKEREEQQIVTDSIVHDLKTVGIHSLKQGGQETVIAGELLHLQTSLQANITTRKAYDYLKVLHPTPAVCGLPKKTAMKFITDNEGYERSFYTGYLGLIEPEAEEYFVNLRCMQIIKDGVILYAGGGITSKSNALDEFEETENKMKTMVALLSSKIDHL